MQDAYDPGGRVEILAYFSLPSMSPSLVREARSCLQCSSKASTCVNSSKWSVMVSARFSTSVSSSTNCPGVRRKISSALSHRIFLRVPVSSGVNGGRIQEPN